MTTSGTSQPAAGKTPSDASTAGPAESNKPSPVDAVAGEPEQGLDPSDSHVRHSIEPQRNVEVFVADEQDAVAIDTDRWLRLAVQVLAAQGVTGRHTADIEMALYFVDEVAIAALNHQYMGKEGPTDVLSFPIDGEEAMSDFGGRSPDNSPQGPNDDRFDEDDDEQPLLLGDVLICPTVALRNAPDHVGPHHDGTIDDELALLVVHGILHLLGMDHLIEAEAEAMELRERQLLHQFHRPILGDDGDDAGEVFGLTEEPS
jgi:probable rRNA maturation factor